VRVWPRALPTPDMQGSADARTAGDMPIGQKGEAVEVVPLVVRCCAQHSLHSMLFKTSARAKNVK